MRVFQGTNYRFIEKRKAAYVVSGVVLALGIAAMIFNVATLGSWLRYGVDFEGGSLVQIRFEEEITAGDIRAAVTGSGAIEVTRFGSETGHEFQIRAPLADDASITEVAEELEAQLRAGLQGVDFEVRNTELVGAKVGEELQQKALWWL